MNKEFAADLAQLLADYPKGDTAFRVQDDKGTENTYRRKGLDVLRALLVKNLSDGRQYKFLFSNWRSDNRYYMTILSERKKKYLIEFVEIQDNSEIEWSYIPRRRDGRNEERKKCFEKLYGTCSIEISVPGDGVSVDDFLSSVFDVVDVREIAHDLVEDLRGKKYATFPEGRRIERKHKLRERSSRVVQDAKKLHAENNKGRMPCQVCGFDFLDAYGSRGRGFVEAHHTSPLSDLKDRDGTQTSVDDLALVCANCHRMLHIRPWFSVANLRKLVRDRRKRVR